MKTSSSSVLVVDSKQTYYASMYKDYLNCTVTAVMNAFGISYEEANTFMQKECGRKKNSAVVFERVFPNTSLGKKCKQLTFKGNKINNRNEFRVQNTITLGKFCQQYDKGTFIVLVRGHALTVKDGVVYDHSTKLKRQVKFAFQLEDK